MLLNDFVLEDEWKQLYVYDHINFCTTSYVVSKTDKLERTSSSQIISKLQEDMNMITRFGNFISALVMTSILKTSVRKYNLIRALTSALDSYLEMRTYRTAHDTFWPFISKQCLSPSFLLNIQTNKNFLLAHIYKIPFVLFYHRDGISKKCRNLCFSDKWSQSAMFHIALISTTFNCIQDASNYTIYRNSFLCFRKTTYTSLEIFGKVCFSSVRRASSARSDSLPLKVYLLDPTKTYIGSLYTTDHCGRQIAFIWLFYPTFSSMKTAIKLDH